MNFCHCICTRQLIFRATGQRVRAAAAALCLTGLAAPSVALADVASFKVTPADVTSGGAATGVVTVDVMGGQNVALTSSNPALVSVPAMVSVGITGKSFPITTVAGQAGCSILTAKASRSTVLRDAVLFVKPVVSRGAPVSLVLSSTSVVGSQSLTATVSVPPLSGFNPGTLQQITLASSNPSVTLPASVIAGINGQSPGKATFQIATSAVGLTDCSVISATYDGVTSRVLLKLFIVFG